jgi:hypothetical protein
MGVAPGGDAAEGNLMATVLLPVAAAAVVLLVVLVARVSFLS